jgi:cytidylate kinase
MTVITLSRQMGSGGDEIAAVVAARLGLLIIDREVINQAAREAGVPEVALAEIDELGLLGIQPKPDALRLYRETAERIIRGLAEQGNLFLVGRGGQCVLAGRAGVLHVQVIAPQALRIERIRMHCKGSDRAAAARLEASDRARAGYLRRNYHTSWDSSELYDLVLNMAHLTIEAAADIICRAAACVSSAPAEVNA